MTVPASVLEIFHATEVPLLIVVDANGIIRLIEPVDDAAMQPGRNVDAAIGLAGRQFPLTPTQPTVPAEKTKKVP